MLVGYLDDIRRRFRTEHAALGRFKKIVSYFTKGVPYGGTVRVAIRHSETLDEARDHALAFFDRLARYEAGEPVFQGAADDAPAETTAGGVTVAVRGSRAGIRNGWSRCRRVARGAPPACTDGSSSARTGASRP